MVNLESETPQFHWTFDKFADLENGQNEYGFEGSVWKSEMIQSYSIDEAHLSFDSPAEWGEGFPPLRLDRTPDGRYEHLSEDIAYDAVRADTQTHVVLTGRWIEADVGKGVFIAVFPIKQGVEILLEDMATVPIESQPSAAVAHPAVSAFVLDQAPS